MRTTLSIDDDLVRQAAELTGITEKSTLVRESLRALIERETTRWLDRLGPCAKAPTRRSLTRR